AVREVASLQELLTVDSALLHFARLLGTPTESFWGPTDPKTRLRPFPFARDVVHYEKISCSPCVHMTRTAPCGGNNVCMRLACDPAADIDRNPAWVVRTRKDLGR